MSVVAAIALGLLFIALPLAVIYLALVRHYDGSTTATPFQAFQGTYAVGGLLLVGSAVVTPFAVRGSIGTGPAVFAPFLHVVGPAVLLGFGTVVVALGAYGVAVRRS